MKLKDFFFANYEQMDKSERNRFLVVKVVVTLFYCVTAIWISGMLIDTFSGSEVQDLRDELAETKRDYEDEITELETENENLKVKHANALRHKSPQVQVACDQTWASMQKLCRW